MKKGLKIGILSLASVLTLGGLVGCGEDTRIKISVWTTFNTSYQAIIDKAISRFEKNRFL